MPLLVARQWPVLRRAPAAVSPLCRQQRSYRKPTPVENAKRLRPLDAGIVIPSSVSVDPSQILHFVQQLPKKKARRQNFCVFFVTPSFAPWLLDDQAFLSHALCRAYANLTGKPDLEVHALCAVVDKLPASRPFTTEISFEDDISRRNTEPPIAGTGFEGIAYAMLPETASLPSNGPQPSDSGSIDFVIAEHTAGDKLLRDTLRLPLANTVFQTGTPTTMTLSTWKSVSVPNQLKLVSKKNVSHHSIRLVDQSPKLESTLSVPLLPLTMPRAVEGCMGNIIRRVTGSDGKSVQASAELESVVPRFFRSRGQPAQATTAWALVIPAELKEKINTRTNELLSGLAAESEDAQNNPNNVWERLWRSNPPLWSTLVSEALAEGARLHRVLSGGGGWGQKAGLLSLDPVPTSEAADPLDSGDIPRMINDPEDFASTLTPVVRSGDSIQFFISPKSDLAEEAAKFDSYDMICSLLRPKAESQPLGWELGMIPSTMDSIPGESWQHVSTEQNQIDCFRGGFGALTEGGITLTRHVKGPGNNPSLVPNITTIDVPFSRLWAAEEREQGEDPIQPQTKPNSLPPISKKEKRERRLERRFATTPPQRIRRYPWEEPKGSSFRRLFSTMRPSSANITEPDTNKQNPPNMTITELAEALNVPTKTISRIWLGHRGRTYMKTRVAKLMLGVLESREHDLRAQFTDIMFRGESKRAAKGEVVTDVSPVMEHIEKKHGKSQAIHEKLSKNVRAIMHDIHDRSIKKSAARLSRPVRKEGAAAKRSKGNSSIQDPAKLSVRTSASEPAQTPIRRFVSAPSQDAVLFPVRQRLNTVFLEVSRLTEEARITMRGIHMRMPSRITGTPTLRVEAQRPTLDALSGLRFQQPKKSSARVLTSRTPVIDGQIQVWRDKMRKSKIKIDYLKQEYKVLMSAIHRRRLKATPQQLIRWKVEARIAQITDTSNQLTKETPQLLNTIVAELTQIRLAKHLGNLDDPLVRKFLEIETAVQAADKELHRLLRFHAVAAQLVRKVNTSARFAYQKHILVRQQLIKMIHKLRNADTQTLQARLEVLRDFTDNLFVNRPGLTGTDVMAQLEEWEQKRLKKEYMTTYKKLEKKLLAPAGKTDDGIRVRKMFAGRVPENRDVITDSGLVIRKPYMQKDTPPVRQVRIMSASEQQINERAARKLDRDLAKRALDVEQRIQARITKGFEDAKRAVDELMKTSSPSSSRSTLTPTSRRRRRIRRKIPLLTIKKYRSSPKIRIRRPGASRYPNGVRRLPNSPRKRRETKKPTAKKSVFVETVGAWLKG